MPDRYGLFILAVTLLMLTPGPNMALIVANSVAYGVRFGLLTLAGTASAALIHMLLVGVGLQESLAAIGAVFDWVRWAGVAYLVYLGIQTWRAPATDLSHVAAAPRSARRMVGRAFLVGFTNPKVLLFYGAFFPQFIATGRPVTPQVWILCATYVVITVVVDSGWAVGAAWARTALGAHARLRNRISGSLLVGAGLGLALARPR